MHISVLGCGRWGTFLAWYADHLGHEVTLWGRPGSRHLEELSQYRKNEYLTIPNSITLSTDLERVVSDADICIISISAQQLRSFAKELRHLTPTQTTKPFILCMKGLEIGTGKRLSTIMEEELGPDIPVAVWVGPGHVQDFTQGIPNCMVMASYSESLTHTAIQALTSPLIRFYYGQDVIGIEIGAAAKNVVGIAAGMLDGANLTSLKGALMARGTHELSVLIQTLGGNAMTVYGLSHLGDYEATLFSPYSNNRRFGEAFIKGQAFTKLAEGYYTTKALLNIASPVGVELPITSALYDILYKKETPQDVLEGLFLRHLKSE